jgi:hypothetical protein
MTTNAPGDHDQDSDPPTPFGEEPDGPDLDRESDEPGADPDPEPGDLG